MVAANPRFHSTIGPMEVSTVQNPDPIFTRIRDGLHQLGWPIVDLANLENQNGVSILQAAQSGTNYTRQTSAAAFDVVNIGRPNLHVLVNTFVTRILFSLNQGGGAPIATGVEFIRDNRTYQVTASREVILSAGVINTPQLLMLSGKVMIGI